MADEPTLDVRGRESLHRKALHRIAWCEPGGIERIWQDTDDPAERSRRAFARGHYLRLLYATEQWRMRNQPVQGTTSPLR